MFGPPLLGLPQGVWSTTTRTTTGCLVHHYKDYHRVFGSPLQGLSQGVWFYHRVLGSLAIAGCLVHTSRTTTVCLVHTSRTTTGCFFVDELPVFLMIFSARILIKIDKILNTSWLLNPTARATSWKALADIARPCCVKASLFIEIYGNVSWTIFKTFPFSYYILPEFLERVNRICQPVKAKNKFPSRNALFTRTCTVWGEIYLFG